MRPEIKLTQKPMRLRSKNIRGQSGSVSPPAPLPSTSDEGKLAFFKKMRATYENEAITSSELEYKIEQIWKFLSPEQKSKFIRLEDVKINGSSQKENKTEKIPLKKKTTPERIGNVPVEPAKVDERKINCKAIAQVLDLRSDSSAANSANSYKETIKGKMRAYMTEASLATSKRMPSMIPMNMTRRSVSPSPEVEFEDLLLESPPKTVSSEEKKETAATFTSTPKPTTSVISNTVIRTTVRPNKTTLTPAPPTVYPNPLRGIQTQRRLRPKPQVVAVRVEKRMSYAEACNSYYQILSQSDFYAPAAQNLIQPFADVIEGGTIIREYTYYDRL